jgi:leucyl aminopeptidase
VKISLNLEGQTQHSDGICQFLFSDTAKDLVGKHHLKEWERISSAEVFQAKAKEMYSFYDGHHTNVWVGLGDRTEDFDLDDIRRSLFVAYKEINRLKLKKIELRFFPSHLLPEKWITVVGETLTLLSYRFDQYLTKKTPCLLEQAIISVDQLTVPLEKALIKGIAIGKATNEARLLVNEPAGSLTPLRLSDHVRQFGKVYGYDVEVCRQDKIEKMGMAAFLAVAKGSNEEPALMIMRYMGNKKSKQIHGLVGKGLTYDSGGLSIKPTTSMVDMKDDMGGAAAVIGAMNAMAATKLPINVVAVVAACENMISGGGYRPGDILKTMSGKTIFVGNTDAEGRLTLVDAITYIQEKEKVNTVLDIATLTGAAVHTLGTEAAVVLSNDEGAYSKLHQAALTSGEKIWRMPLFKEYEKKIKHHEADYTNMPGQPGSILAGLLLREFIQDRPWVHVDMAGPCFLAADTDYLPKGASGYGVRLLYHYLENQI